MIETPDQARPLQVSSPPPLSGERTWSVGSLTYDFRSLSKVFGWLLCGDFALAVRDRAMQGVIQLLFKKFGASDMFTGLLLVSLPAALGLIIGPMTAYKSDRLRTRWGRRIPFLMITTPPLVVSLLGLAFSPQLGAGIHGLFGAQAPEIATCILAFLGLFWLIFEISIVAASAVFGALINDVVPQEVLGRFFGLFRAVSLVVGIVFFFWLMGEVEAHPAEIFLSVAIIYGVGFTLMCLNVREGTYPPPPAAAAGPGNALIAVKTYFREGFGNPYYLWLFAATTLGGIAASPFNMFSIVYAKSLAMDLPMFGKCLALTYFVSLCLSFPLGWLVDRFHPLRVSLFVMALYAMVMGASFVFVHDQWTFAIALVAHGVLAGTYNTSSPSLGQRLLPREKFAEINSAGGIIGSVAGMCLAPAVGYFLDQSGNDYRYTFLGSYGIAAMALAPFYVLHRKFMALGGPDHYRAPEPSGA